MKISSLDRFHKGNGAVFFQREGWRLPAHFGDPGAEYASVRSGAGWLDLADQALLSVAGPDSVGWLQGMLSNDVAALGTGQGMVAAILNIQGKILADVRVLRTAGGFLLEVDEPLAPGVLEHLHRHLIADQVEIVELSGELAMISIQGPASETLLSGLLDAAALPAEELSHRERVCAGSRIRAVRATHTGEPGFDLLVPRDRLPAMMALPRARAIPWIGLNARETLRIEAGIPRYGVDMDADTLLLETGLQHAVSFTKGCYLGQETVERIHSRGHVNRRLVGLKAEGDIVPHPRDTVRGAGRDIGRITSASASPRLGCPIALGYLHRDYVEPGSRVTIGHGDLAIPATVHALPF